MKEGRVQYGKSSTTARRKEEYPAGCGSRFFVRLNAAPPSAQQFRHLPI